MKIIASKCIRCGGVASCFSQNKYRSEKSWNCLNCKKGGIDVFYHTIHTIKNSPKLVEYSIKFGSVVLMGQDEVSYTGRNLKGTSISFSGGSKHLSDDMLNPMEALNSDGMKLCLIYS